MTDDCSGRDAPHRGLRRWRGAAAAAWVAWAALTAPAVSQAAEPIPAEAFFKRDKLREAALSPSGRWLAALSAIPGRRVGFMMMDLEGKEATRFIEASTEADVGWFRWVSDDWLVFGIEDPDNRGGASRGGGLMSVKRDGSSSRMLIHRQWGKKEVMVQRNILEPNHYLIGLGAPGSDEVIVGAARHDDFGDLTDVAPMALKVSTGSLRTLLKDRPKATNWWLDAQGRARLAALTQAGQISYFWSDSGDGPWRQIAKMPALDASFTPRYIDGDTLVVGTGQGKDGHTALRRFDFAAGQPAPEVLLATPGFSPGVGTTVDRSSGRVLGLHLRLDATTNVWFDDRMRALQQKVDAKLPGRVNILHCSACLSDKPVLIYSYADTNPGDYVLYRPKDDRWQLLDSVRPDIDPARMARLEFARTVARDGAELPLWLTRHPAGDKQARPAVVLVHGGPWDRGEQWHWHDQAQFLASRGYVVIEPEFRGSTGYGWTLFEAGWKQWGLTMQDDVSDALAYAVQRGLVDPKRVCIVGGSYGGYASLMGLVKNPDQYRCGVAFAAVTDQRYMFDFHWNDFSDETRSYGLPALLGDRQKDEARFIATSPVAQAARITAPVLLAHGFKDRRVPIDNGERMRDALLKAGKSVDWVMYPEAGHGFEREEDAIDFWKRVDRFLAKHLN